MLPQEFDTSLVAALAGRKNLVPYMDGRILYDTGQATYEVNPAIDPNVLNHSSIDRLYFNQRYQFSLNLPDGQGIQLEFSSAYDPLYTSAEIIRQDLGDIVAELTDDQINFKIYQVSQMAQQLAGAAQRYILFGSAVGNIILQFEGVPKSSMKNSIPYPSPFYVLQYARFKTELELVYAKFVTLSTMSGMMEKDLGDFKVIRQIMLPRLQEVLADLKFNLQEWENQLRGGAAAKPKRTIKSRTSTYGLGRGGTLGYRGMNMGGTS